MIAQKIHHVVHKINPLRANLEGPIFHFSSSDSILLLNNQ
jgi:hypothetical protein